VCAREGKRGSQLYAVGFVFVLAIKYFCPGSKSGPRQENSRREDYCLPLFFRFELLLILDKIFEAERKQLRIVKIKLQFAPKHSLIPSGGNRRVTSPRDRVRHAVAS
jgi:hypothetical protein